MEYGTYEEVQKDFSATARRVALETRQKQTLTQLGVMQLDEPGIIRLRRPTAGEVAELDSNPPPLAELEGSSFEANSEVPAGLSYKFYPPHSVPQGKSRNSNTENVSQTKAELQAHKVTQGDQRHLSVRRLTRSAPASNRTSSVSDIMSDIDDTFDQRPEILANTNHEPFENRNNCTSYTFKAPRTVGDRQQRTASTSATTSGQMTAGLTCFYNCTSSCPETHSKPVNSINSEQYHSYFEDLDHIVQILPLRRGPLD